MALNNLDKRTRVQIPKISIQVSSHSLKPRDSVTTESHAFEMQGQEETQLKSSSLHSVESC